MRRPAKAPRLDGSLPGPACSRSPTFSRRWLMLSCLGLAACRVHPTPPQESLVTAFDRFIDAFNRLDFSTFCTYLDTDATLFNPLIIEASASDRLDGRDRVVASFRQVFDAARQSGHGPDIHPRTVLVQRFGDSAVVSFEFNRPGGSMGRRTLVWVHRVPGWKIVHIHASNTPAVAPKAE